MHPRHFAWWYEDKTREYKFRFNDGYITINAKSEEEARILAQAEAIKRDWDYEILPNTMSMEELKELIGDKVDEIVNVYTERINASKDLDSFDETTLDMIKVTLAAFITKAYK
jgi:hypothetical protein